MLLREQNILFFTRTMMLGGTENVILQLCEIFHSEVNKIVVCSSGGINVNKLQQMGIKHYTIPDIEVKNIKNIFSVFFTLRKIVREEHITVIHTHHRMAAFYVRVARLDRKCTFINTSHNTFKDKKKLTQMIYKKANLIACGEIVKENLVHYFGLPEEKVFVIHNAVKPFEEVISNDTMVEKLHQQGKFVVANIGRLSEQKGMTYFIKAIPAVIRVHPETFFLIVGIGPEEKNLKMLVQETGVGAYIEFMGYRKDIQNLISQIDLLVLSSLWEGLPLTPIEAFSVGKTVIATAVDGTVEIVRDGIDGFLVEPKNSAALAERLIHVIENPEEKHRLEVSAKERYMVNYSFTQFAHSYLSYYKRL